MVDIDYEQIKYDGELYVFPTFKGYLKRSKDIPYFYTNEECNENGYTRLESIWYDEEKDVICIKVGVILPFKTTFNEFELRINSFCLTLNNYKNNCMAILKPDNLRYAYETVSWDVWFEAKDQKLLKLLKSGDDVFRFTAKFNLELSIINEMDGYAHE